MRHILLRGRKAKEGQCKQRNMKESKQKLTWMQGVTPGIKISWQVCCVIYGKDSQKRLQTLQYCHIDNENKQLRFEIAFVSARE